MQPLRTPDRAQHPNQNRTQGTQQCRREREQAVPEQVDAGAFVPADLAVVVPPRAEGVVPHERRDLLQHRRDDERDEAGARRRLDVLDVHRALHAALLRVLLGGPVGRRARSRGIVERRAPVGLAPHQRLGDTLELLVEFLRGVDGGTAAFVVRRTWGVGRASDERCGYARRRQVPVALAMHTVSVCNS